MSSACQAAARRRLRCGSSGGRPQSPRVSLTTHSRLEAYSLTLSASGCASAPGHVESAASACGAHARAAAQTSALVVTRVFISYAVPSGFAGTTPAFGTPAAPASGGVRPPVPRHTFSMTRPVAGIAAGLVALLLATGAVARVFGPEPTAVSARANAPSGSPAISGDNRVVRYVAFNSFASDLVPGDTNGAGDVFLYNRFSRTMSRVSVSSRGVQANGDSSNSAVDGSVQNSPRCVAFQSVASNLSPADRDRTPDIFVRDFKARKTRLVSRGLGSAAVDPAIAGDCRQVAFTSVGRIYVGNGLKGGRPHFVARGTNPDLSLDGSALTWERGHGVWFKRRGRTSKVAEIGGNPHVSDGGASRIWSVVYDGASDVYMKVFKS